MFHVAKVIAQQIQIRLGGVTGGSLDEGAIIAVSAQKPITLIRILNELPMVEKVDKKRGKIVVTLKTPTVN